VLGGFHPHIANPGPNGLCLILTDTRKGIRVIMDTFVDLSVLNHGYPWRILRDIVVIPLKLSELMDVRMEIYGKPRIFTRISIQVREHAPFNLDAGSAT